MKNFCLVIAVFAAIFIHSQTQDSLQVSLGSKTLKEVIYTSVAPQNLKINEVSGISISELLQNIKGFQLNGSSLNISEPKTFSVRGASNRNVLILIDDVPLREITGSTYNTYDLRNVALYNVESIEILNGASSVLYGSNASVSVINIKTKKKNSSEKINGNVELSYGSFNTFQQNAMISGNVEKWLYQVNANNEKSKGFSAAKDVSNTQNFDDDGFEKQNTSAKIGYNFTNGNIFADFGYNHLLYDYDAYEFTDAKNRGRNTDYFAGINGKFNHKLGELQFHFRQTQTEKDFQNFDYNTANYQSNYYLNGNNSFAELFNEFPITHSLQILAGAQYDRQAIDIKNTLYDSNFNPYFAQIVSKDSTKIAALDAFAEARFTYKNFNINAGARLNTHSDYASQLTYALHPFMFFMMNENKLKVSLSISSAYNSPTLYQLFGDGIYTLQNTNLQPETTLSYEGNLSYFDKKNRFTASFTAFYRDEKELLEYQYNASTFQGNYFNNTNSTFAKGIETEVNVKVSEKVNFSTNFSYVEKDKESSMLRIPNQRWNNTLLLKFFKGNNISMVHQFVSAKDDAFFDNQTFTTKMLINKAYHLFHCFIQQKITENFLIHAAVKNLFNTNFVDISGYNVAERNYQLAIQYQF